MNLISYGVNSITIENPTSFVCALLVVVRVCRFFESRKQQHVAYQRWHLFALGGVVCTCQLQQAFVGGPLSNRANEEARREIFTIIRVMHCLHQSPEWCQLWGCQSQRMKHPCVDHAHRCSHEDCWLHPQVAFAHRTPKDAFMTEQAADIIFVDDRGELWAIRHIVTITPF